MKIYRIPKENFKKADVEPKAGKDIRLQLGKEGKKVKVTITKVEKDSVFAKTESKEDRK